MIISNTGKKIKKDAGYIFQEISEKLKKAPEAVDCENGDINVIGDFTKEERTIILTIEEDKAT